MNLLERNLKDEKAMLSDARAACAALAVLLDQPRGHGRGPPCRLGVSLRRGEDRSFKRLEGADGKLGGDPDGKA